jgi:transcriptional regulator with XRE-family HTH domain
MLRDIREQRGLSVRDLGKLARVHFSMISQLERGESNPSIHLALRLSRILNTSVEALFGHLEEFQPEVTHA